MLKTADFTTEYNLRSATKSSRRSLQPGWTQEVKGYTISKSTHKHCSCRQLSSFWYDTYTLAWSYSTNAWFCAHLVTGLEWDVIWFTKYMYNVSYSAWSSTTDVAVQHRCLLIHSILLAVQYVLCSSHPHREHEPGLRGWLAGCHISAHAEQRKLACPAPETHPGVRINM